jgi:hypothetical protein
MAGDRAKLSFLSASFLALGLLSIPDAAVADDHPPLLHAPSLKAVPKPKLAVLFALKLRLPEGNGLARQLLDAGVDADDAAVAARLAAGHLGDGVGGCEARIEVSRGMEGGGFRLERVVLLTDAAQTTIERRQGELALASERATRTVPRFV